MHYTGPQETAVALLLDGDALYGCFAPKKLLFSTHHSLRWSYFTDHSIMDRFEQDLESLLVQANPKQRAPLNTRLSKILRKVANRLVRQNRTKQDASSNDLSFTGARIPSSADVPTSSDELTTALSDVSVDDSTLALDQDSFSQTERNETCHDSAQTAFSNNTRDKPTETSDPGSYQASLSLDTSSEENEIMPGFPRTYEMSDTEMEEFPVAEPPLSVEQNSPVLYEDPKDEVPRSIFTQSGSQRFGPEVEIHRYFDMESEGPASTFENADLNQFVTLPSDDSAMLEFQNSDISFSLGHSSSNEAYQYSSAGSIGKRDKFDEWARNFRQCTHSSSSNTACEVDEVERKINELRSGNMLSSETIQDLLPLFQWDESTLLLKPMHTNVDYHKMTGGTNPIENDSDIVVTAEKKSAWPVEPRHRRIIAPCCLQGHWILLEIERNDDKIRLYDSKPGFIGQTRLEDLRKHLLERIAAFGNRNRKFSLEKSKEQQNGVDCGVFLLENARRISDHKTVDAEPVKAKELRLFMAEKLGETFLDHRSEKWLEHIAYPDHSVWWHVGARCQLDKRPADTAGDDLDLMLSNAPDLEMPSTLETQALRSKFQPYLDRLQGCTITPISDEHEGRYYQMFLAFGCSEHLLALKRAIIRYRALQPEGKIEGVRFASHLYQVGLWTEHLGLINTIMQRYVRAHFAYLIDREKESIMPTNKSERAALSGAVKAVATSIYPSIEGWDKSELSKKMVFSKIQSDLLRWRRDSAIWSIVRTRFSSLAILALVPHQVRLSGAARSISGSSFQNEIPPSFQASFVDALMELRPNLQKYIPKLELFFEVLFDPMKFRDCIFNIEKMPDPTILKAPLESDILIDAFDLQIVGEP